MRLEATLTLAEAARPCWDVAVVGAGPAGALAAYLLVRRGLTVLLIEKTALPRWKVCGSCLNGPALACLRRANLGELPARWGAVPLRYFHLAIPGRGARLALPAGVALSRLAFDVALAAEAVQAGAAFLAETQAGPTTSASAARLVRLQCRGQSVEVRARVVLAACGLSGSFGAEQRPEIAAGSRIGAGLLLPDGPAFFAPGTIYMACGRSGYLGAVRVENGQLDLAAALAPEAVRAAGGPGRAAEALLEGTGWPAIPGLHRGPWRGTPALTRRAGRLAAPRLFFLGDAAGYVEPFTGEGIAWALASAHAVVPLALRGVYSWQPELAAEWTTLHRRLVGRRQWMCRALAAALRRPWLTRGLVEGLARLPGAAAALLRWFHAVPAHWEANHEFCDPWLGDRAAAAHHFARPGRGGGPAALLHEPGGGSDAHPALPAVRD